MQALADIGYGIALVIEQLLRQLTSSGKHNAYV